MHRIEQKFLLTTAQYVRMVLRLRALLTADPHSESDGTYPIANRYFDTRFLDFFNNKSDGEFHQLKIRVRRYATSFDTSGPTFLEAKFKEATSQQKIRIPLDCEDQTLFDPWRRINDSRFEFFCALHAVNPIHPVCTVTYRREAFQADARLGNVRINIDTDIRVTAVGYYRERLDFLPLHILEVKSASPELPGFLHNEFKAAGIEQSTFSKYHFAVNLLLSLHQS